MNLPRRLVAEGVGTALLLAAVVGSGIMGERLAGGNVAIALLANTIATGSTLAALILTFGPISGAHFNPAVTLADASRGWLSWGDVPPYIAVQLAGAVAGVFAAHLMFGEKLLQFSQHVRAGGAQLLSEFVATFGLLAVIWGCSRKRFESVPLAVGLYITGAYWFTASTSFANPAVIAARALTNTFAGIRPADAPGFIGAQLVGAFVATLLFRWFEPALTNEAERRRPAPKGHQHVMTKRVLILCTGNSARSQMAEGLLRSFGGDRFQVGSAGTRPSIVRPEAIAVMSELGIDLSGHRSKHVREFDSQHFDYVITVCDHANESCPVFPDDTERIHWSVPDPAAVEGSETERLAAFRRVRDALAEMFRDFIDRSGVVSCNSAERSDWNRLGETSKNRRTARNGR